MNKENGDISTCHLLKKLICQCANSGREGLLIGALVYLLYIVSQVFYPYCFAFALGERAFFDQFKFGGNQYFIFKLAGDFFADALQFDVVIGREIAQFYFDDHFVLVVDCLQGDEVVAAQLWELHEYLFHLHREDVDSFDNEHVVTASFDAVYAQMSASAGAFSG